jgi:hypothetical protein
MRRNAFVAAISRQARAATAIGLPDARPESNERRAAGDGAAGIGASRSGAVSTRRAAPPAAARDAARVGEAEARDQQRERQRRDAEPQRPVHEQDRRPPDEPRVLLGGRPVLRRVRDRAAAEGIEQRLEGAAAEGAATSAATVPSRNSATPPRYVASACRVRAAART